MNPLASIDSSQPTGSLMRMERSGEVLRLRLRRPARAGTIGYTWVVLALGVGLVSLLNGDALPVVVVLFGAVTLAAVPALMRWLDRPVLTIDSRYVTVHLRAPALLLRQCYRWPRSAIVAVAYWQGLRIVTPSRNVCVLAHWPKPDLLWVAEVLRRQLDVPAELPSEEGEIPVRYVGNLWQGEETGLLSAGRGWLQLRHSLAESPHLTFEASDDSLHLIQGRAIRLTSTDIVCRPDEDRGAWLDIAPRHVYCDCGGGKVFLRIGALGRFLYGRIDLPAKVADKTDFTGDNAPFRLSLWSAEREELASALARFWGAAE